jgi:hypothetical protein
MSSSKSFNTPSKLRSREEFFLGGTVPEPAQPDDCTICTEPLETDVIKILACGRLFHLVCVLAWFKSNSARHGSCPNCRCELFGPEPHPVPVDAPEPLPATVDAHGRDDAWYVNAHRDMEIASAVIDGYWRGHAPNPRRTSAAAPDSATVDGNGRDDAWYVNAEREAELADAVIEYRLSGARAPHPAWFVSAEREVELANARRNRVRYENAARAELAAATADRSRASNPQQSTGRAVRPSLPPRASSPVRYPRRSARASAPRNDFEALEELDGKES